MFLYFRFLQKNELTCVVERLTKEYPFLGNRNFWRLKATDKLYRLRRKLSLKKREQKSKSTTAKKKESPERKKVCKVIVIVSNLVGTCRLFPISHES